MYNAWQKKPGLTERLVELQPHLSANEIASALSDEFKIKLTRSQVLGKTSRLKLMPRELPKPVQESRVRAVAPPLPPLSLPAPSRPHCASYADALPIVRLEADCCKFLFGDYPFTCCTEPRAKGSSYCIGHHQQAHQPPVPYSRRRVS